MNCNKSRLEKLIQDIAPFIHYLGQMYNFTARQLADKYRIVQGSEGI